MPSSSPAGKEFIRAWVLRQPDIRSIVDVGAGEGTYSRLLGRDKRITAIEIFEPYVERYGLRDLYDEVIVGDARAMELPEADCYVFGDVLEHMTRDEAVALVDKVRGKHVIISLPLGHFPQGEMYGNVYETHLHTWTAAEAEKTFDFPIKMTPDGMGIFIR